VEWLLNRSNSFTLKSKAFKAIQRIPNYGIEIQKGLTLSNEYSLVQVSIDPIYELYQNSKENKCREHNLEWVV